MVGRVLGVVLWSICLDVCMDLRWCRWRWKEIFCWAVCVHRRCDWFCLGLAVVSWPVVGVVDGIWRVVGLAGGHSAGGGGGGCELRPLRISFKNVGGKMSWTVFTFPCLLGVP